MKPDSSIRAYIDAANLHKGVAELGWELDYRRLRRWLSDKYGVGAAYLFIGRIPKYSGLYTALQEAGFILVFKEVIYDGYGKAKGNCDADLIVRAMRDSYEGTTSKTLLVTSDGDYTPLVKFLQERNQIEAILSPASVAKCSVLLKRTGAPIAYLGDQRSLLERHIEKAPSRDEPGKDLFRSDV